MKHHDGFYKRILSCRQMVSSYLLDYVRAGFVADMDMATLELVSGSFVSDDLHSRENDVIWKVKWRGADAYLYVMIEAQRKRDSLMAVRLLNYTTALWLQLRDSGTASRETGLPPVFPLVIYSGEEPWNEPFDLSSLLSPWPESVLEFQPKYKYYVIDERRIAKEDIAARPGLASLFIRLEQAAFPEEVQRIVAACAVRLAGPEYAGLNHAIAAWVSYTVLQRDGFATENQLKAIDSLQGVNSFMESNIQKWIAGHEAVGEARGMARGRAEGREEGREEGRAEGEAGGIGESLVSFLESRLGSVPEKFRMLVAKSASADLLRALRDQAYRAEDLPAFVLRMEKELLKTGGGTKGA